MKLNKKKLNSKKYSLVALILSGVAGLIVGLTIFFTYLRSNSLLTFGESPDINIITTGAGAGGGTPKTVCKMEPIMCSRNKKCIVKYYRCNR